MNEKQQKLLMLLGSNIDNECLAALRMLKNSLQKENRTWTQFVQSLEVEEAEERPYSFTFKYQTQEEDDDDFFRKNYYRDGSWEKAKPNWSEPEADQEVSREEMRRRTAAAADDINAKNAREEFERRQKETDDRNRAYESGKRWFKGASFSK